MKNRYLICLLTLFLSAATFAQKKEKYVPSEPPPEILSPAKIYHFEGEENGLKVSLELQRKTAMSTKYALEIEYPDKRILTEEGIVYMRENYDLGTEERLKESNEVMVSCQPFTPKKQTKGNYLEICIGEDLDENADATGKIFVSLQFSKKSYPTIDLENTPELVEP